MTKKKNNDVKEVKLTKAGKPRKKPGRKPSKKKLYFAYTVIAHGTNPHIKKIILLFLALSGVKFCPQKESLYFIFLFFNLLIIIN